MRKALDARPGARRGSSERLWQLHEIGSLGDAGGARGKGTAAPLLLHAPRRQAEPAGALRARRARDGAGPRARRREPLRGRRHARARLVVPVRGRRAWSPTASPTTATRSRRCTCATSATGEDLPDVIPRTRACSLAWLPDGNGFYYTRYPAPRRRCRPARRSTTAHVFFHRLGDDPGARPQDLRRRPRPHGLAQRRRCRPTAAGWRIEVSQGWTKSEVYPRRHARNDGAAGAGGGGQGRALQRRRGARRSPLRASPTRARRATGSSRSIRAHPARAHWKRDHPRGPTDTLEAVPAASAASWRRSTSRTRRRGCALFDRQRQARARDAAAGPRHG